jgi:hypothetical protein
VAIFVVAGLVWYRSAIQAQRTQSLEAASLTYLNAVMSPSRAVSSGAICKLTAPGSAARIEGEQLHAQVLASQSPELLSSSVHIQLIGAVLTASQTLNATVVINRQFRPRGRSTITTQGTFLFTANDQPQLKSVSLSTNVSQPSSGPDPFTLNLWGRVPVGPLPHGV